MNERDLRVGLSSPDRDVVLNALFALGGEKDAAPSDETLRLASSHLSHADPDVRRQAVFAVAIHWAFEPSFAELLRLISVEQDEEVAQSVVLALGRMGSASPSLKKASLEALARISQAPDRPEGLRSLAFVEARWVAGKTSASEYAAELLEPGKVKFDAAWLSEIVTRTP